MTRPRRQDRRTDTGAAVVEFVGVLGLLLMLFLSVLQLGLVLHLRNVMTAAAAEGARFAANADRTDEEGASRAREALGQAFAGKLIERMRIVVDRDGVDPGVVVVTITAPAPVLLPVLSPVTLTAKGHALEEGR